jgi:hypothetical protein
METSKNLTLPGFEQTESELTQSVEASRARTSARQAQERELRAKGLGYGASTPALLANYDPESCSWRTSQRCLVEGWTEFSETWPRSGMMQNGIAYRLPPLVRLTDATGCGFWPTPDQRGFTNDGSLMMLREKCRTREEWSAMSYRKGAGLKEKLWPTPRASEWKGVGPLGSKSHKHRLNRQYLDATVQEYEQVTGSLNPTWVEWLMGFPTGHTALKP